MHFCFCFPHDNGVLIREERKVKRTERKSDQERRDWNVKDKEVISENETWNIHSSNEGN